jgi:pyridoxine 5-phosphate synthase
MISLNVNIDHFATLRNARGGSEPDPITGALMAEIAGASGIVCHLREDRRHIKDNDVKLLRELVQTKLDLEMGANEEIIKFALDIKPDLVTIVPEKREELTTEGGLNLLADINKFKTLVDKMHQKDIFVSFFIEPTKEQIDAVLETKAEMIEIHTGTYANFKKEKDLINEFEKIQSAVQYAHSKGLVIAAGHGLNYQNTKLMCKIKEIHELSIGHSIIARAMYVGISQAVKEMIDLMSISEMI